MTELFLDDTKVIISSDQTIKLCRENPLISSSGDYTLEVQLPLSLIDNRSFFGAWHRIEKRKKTRTYKARLYVNNMCVLNGSAKVTAITNEEVKLQLYGDRSEFNAVFGDLYIDELTLPYVTGTKYHSVVLGGSRTSTSTTDETTDSSTEANPLALTADDEGWQKYVCPSVYDETEGEVVNPYTSCKMAGGTYAAAGPVKKVPMFNLLYAVRQVFTAIGYDIDISSYDREPYNHLIIASCKGSAMKNSLPHWKLKEFAEQLQYLFGCVFVFSSSAMKVTMTPSTSAAVSGTVSVECEDGFTVEVDDDDTVNGTGTSDLHYDLSDSEYHDTDYIEEDKLEQLPVIEYDSYDALLTAYEAMTAEEKGASLLRCPQGDYCQWIYQGVSDTETKLTKLIHVNQFGDLIRNTDESEDETDNTIDLKICPVAMAEDIPVNLLYELTSGTGNHSGDIYGIGATHPVFAYKDEFGYQIMPAMESQESDTAASGTSGSASSDANTEIETTAIQDLIQSDDDTSSSDKPDRMELFFWDGAVQQATRNEFSGDTVTVNAPAVFTAYDHKDLKGVTHEKWSMTLKRAAAGAQTMGQLHNEFTLDQTKKYTVKFISQSIPSPSDVFIINNRRFCAEKIEIELKDGRMSPLMTGYFYEIQ